MFFAKLGEYPACNLFTTGHFFLIIVTIIGIIIALKNTINKTKEEVKNIIKKCTVFLCIFEIFIIIFKITTSGNIRNLNNYVPLYYCSLLLYAGLLSSFANGRLKRMGDVFLATGGIIGGIVFIIFPTTSLYLYPMFHLVSIHSFIFHGIMVYLGLIINFTNYIEITLNDIKYYALLVGIICVLAYIVNSIFNSNLMFISQNFPGTPIEIFYNFMGKFYTVFMCLAQMTLPFYIMYPVNKKLQKRKDEIKEEIAEWKNY